MTLVAARSVRHATSCDYSSLVVKFLIELPNDEEVAGHAVIALGQIRDPRAAQAFEPFLAHEKAWIRKEAKKALKRIARP